MFNLAGGWAVDVCKFDEVVSQACERAAQLQSRGADREKVLSALTEAAETVAGEGAVASILVLDEEGLLRNGASPGLPVDYLAAIDRIRPHPNVGTCAAAAATGEIVFTPDFRSDDKWAELRHLPMGLGFSSAWSMPIKSPDQSRVLGTLGTYFRESRIPHSHEVEAVRKLAAAAGGVLKSSTG